MTTEMIEQCAARWKERGLPYAVHYQHTKDASLQFVDGHSEDRLVPDKRMWKNRGYAAKRVFIFQTNR